MDHRIDQFICYEPNSGCWLWTGFVNNGGYGRLQRRGRSILAHRYVYEMHRGPVPDGLQLDHRCRVTCCVNPAHLEPVTNAVNVKRGWDARGLRTVCKRGHVVVGHNAFRRTNGRVECRACRNINRKSFLRKHGVTHARYIQRAGVH